MKIKQEEVQRVCRLVLEKLKEKKLIMLKSKENTVYEALVATFIKNLHEEEVLDRKAEEILEENTPEDQPGFDRQKMFLMIKRKLAKEKGFVL